MREIARAAFVIIAALAPGTLHGQSPPRAVVSIQVTDSAGAPLEFATALLKHAGIQGTSGPDGRILLRNLPPGRDTLTVRRIGYTPITVTATLTAGETLQLDVVLDPMPFALNDIEVIARPGLGTFERRRQNGSTPSRPPCR